MTTEEKKDQQVAQKPAEPEKVMSNSVSIPWQIEFCRKISTQ